MRTYKTINRDLDNYEAKLRKYQSKIKDTQQEKKQRIINDIGLHFLNANHLNIEDIKNDKTLFEKYSFSRKNSNQEALQKIGKELLDKMNLNLNDMINDPELINNYSIIDQKTLNKYKQANHNYQIMIKKLSTMANHMYQTNQGYYHISNNDLPKLSTWLHDDFRTRNYYYNQDNNKSIYNN